MQDLSYESFKQGKFKAKKTNLDLSYSTFLAEREKIKAIELEREQLREQGLPVGTTSRKAGPTTAGSIVRAPLKLAADVATNLGNIHNAGTGTWETPYSGDYLGKVEGLGKVDITKSPFEKENLKTIKKSVGTGLELASYLGYGGVGSSAVKAGISKLTETAAKETFREYFVSQFPSLLKEGALTGLAYTTGSQLREDKGFSWKQALIDVGTSTVLTPAAALGLRKVFGTSANKIIKAREVERAAKEAEILNKPIPEVGTPFDKMKTNADILNKEFVPTTPTKEVKPTVEVQEGAFVETPKATPTNPLETRALKFDNKLDFIASEIAFLNRTQQKIPAKLQEQASKAWEKMHPIADTSKVNKIPLTKKGSIETPIAETPIKETIETPTREIPTTKETPEVMVTPKELEDAYEVATKNFEPDEWDATTLKEQLGRFKELEQTDPEKLFRLAMNSKEGGDILKNNWALSFLENEANRTGNIELSKQLSYSNVGRKAGQELVGGRFKDRDTLASIMRDVRKSRAQTQGVSQVRLDKEEQELLKKLNEHLKTYKEGKITKGEIDDIIRDITCK